MVQEDNKHPQATSFGQGTVIVTAVRHFGDHQRFIVQNRSAGHTPPRPDSVSTIHTFPVSCTV